LTPKLLKRAIYGRKLINAYKKTVDGHRIKTSVTTGIITEDFIGGWIA